jgi:hypothetical protein
VAIISSVQLGERLSSNKEESGRHQGIPGAGGNSFSSDRVADALQFQGMNGEPTIQALVPK